MTATVRASHPDCQDVSVKGIKMTQGAAPFAVCVQFHDILSIVFRDILYTPARAKRAPERAKGCLSEPWMFENKEFSSW